mmetsp:Transcript_98580/g.144345  ORF Transcript_98580/g.144345 Transcript_98580/m.144345 type:complete len:223 (+) Transcript_98580:1089-1757(+)
MLNWLGKPRLILRRQKARWPLPGRVVWWKRAPLQMTQAPYCPHQYSPSRKQARPRQRQRLRRSLQTRQWVTGRRTRLRQKQQQRHSRLFLTRNLPSSRQNKALWTRCLTRTRLYLATPTSLRQSNPTRLKCKKLALASFLPIPHACNSLLCKRRKPLKRHATVLQLRDSFRKRRGGRRRWRSWATPNRRSRMRRRCGMKPRLSRRPRLPLEFAVCNWVSRKR